MEKSKFKWLGTSNECLYYRRSKIFMKQFNESRNIFANS